MIKKLVALSVVILLPVTFISSASAASKPITCYKGTASKVVKNSTGKCPTGWSSKKPVTPKTPSNTSNASYKIQDISSSEVAEIVNAIKDIQTPITMSPAMTAISEASKECLVQFNKTHDDKQLHACRDNVANLTRAEYKNNPPKYKFGQYLPLTKKLVDNFCGLNKDLLAENYSLIRKSDKLAGYQKYNEEVMSKIYKNLAIIERNRGLSITTSSTDAFLGYYTFILDSSGRFFRRMCK